MSVHVLPIFTFVANPLPDQSPRIGLTLVPMNDENCWRFSSTLVTDQSFAPRPGQNPSLFLDDQGHRQRRADNDYLLDREVQRTTNYTGILGVSNQDYAVTESMGPIYDRSQEHLGTTDLAIIRLRQQLIDAARNLEKGVDPPGVDLDIAWDRLRSEERVIGPDEDWRTLGTEQDARYREVMGAAAG
jgi:phthalate 4,5-dioxygenase oxygenase subunit